MACQSNFSCTFIQCNKYFVGLLIKLKKNQTYGDWKIQDEKVFGKTELKPSTEVIAMELGQP